MYYLSALKSYEDIRGTAVFNKLLCVVRDAPPLPAMNYGWTYTYIKGEEVDPPFSDFIKIGG